MRQAARQGFGQQLPLGAEKIQARHRGLQSKPRAKRACPSDEEIEICLTVQPGEERLEVIESCGYVDRHGGCHYKPGASNSEKTGEGKAKKRGITALLCSLKILSLSHLLRVSEVLA